MVIVLAYQVRDDDVREERLLKKAANVGEVNRVRNRSYATVSNMVERVLLLYVYPVSVNTSASRRRVLSTS